MSDTKVNIQDGGHQVQLLDEFLMELANTELRDHIRQIDENATKAKRHIYTQFALAVCQALKDGKASSLCDKPGMHNFKGSEQTLTSQATQHLELLHKLLQQPNTHNPAEQAATPTT